MIKKFLNFMNLQRISLAISTFGVSFQVFVLNPWHSKISLQLGSLENKMNNIENKMNNMENKINKIEDDKTY